MSEVAIGCIALCIMIGVFLTGIEMFVGMAVVGLIGYAILISPEAAVNILANDVLDQLESYSLTVVPLFVLMGQIAFNAGLARRLFDCANKFMGHVNGGLAMATVAGATVFKAICGSLIATTATFASVAIPEMDRFKYSKKLSCGIVATVSALGALIPPSVTLILLGIITQESIGKLFIAGIIPGLLMAFFFAVIIFGWSHINPEIGPASGVKYAWKDRFKSLPSVAWPVLIFLVMIIGLMKGFFTPTEAGSMGTFFILLLCIFKREINFASFRKSLKESLRTASMVLMLLAASAILGHFIAVTGIPAAVAEWAVSLPLPPFVVMSIIFAIYLFGGSFIDDLAFMILATPIFYPVIIKIGYNPVWACIMLAFTVCVGSVIPPVATPVFVVKNITKVPLKTIYQGVYPFLLSLLTVIVLLFVFPELVTFLPNLLMK